MIKTSRIKTDQVTQVIQTTSKTHDLIWKLTFTPNNLYIYTVTMQNPSFHKVFNPRDRKLRYGTIFSNPVFTLTGADPGFSKREGGEGV